MSNTPTAGQDPSTPANSMVGSTPVKGSSGPAVSPATVEAKAAKTKSSAGCYVVFDNAGNAVTTFSGEIVALRKAIAIGGSARWNDHGSEF